MQRQKHFWHARRLLTRRSSLLVLLGAAVLLAMLSMAGWDSARAAPQSGGPTLFIESFNDNTLTLQFDGWTRGETVTLSYSANKDCSASHSLPNAAFLVSADPLTVTYTWPSSGIAPGTYFLCGTAPNENTIPSMQTITVNSNGSVQAAPGGSGSTPVATSSPGATASATPGGSGSPGNNGSPGNKGTSSTSNGGDNTLVAIILLCVLVLALLAYLTYMLLQSRQTATPSPPKP
jgi:hypothetical protein